MNGKIFVAVEAQRAAPDVREMQVKNFDEQRRRCDGEMSIEQGIGIPRRHAAFL